MSEKYKYTALDVAALAGIAVISGAIFLIASNYAYSFLVGLSVVYPIFAVIWPIMYGVWFIGGTAAAYIIRKPGSAFAGEFLGALVELALAPIFGPFVLLWGVIQGASSELVFAIWRYKRWDYLSMGLAGFLPGLPIAMPGWIFFPELIDAAYSYAGYAGIAGYIILHAISGFIIAGLLTKYFIDKIALTGIFDLFEVGKEARKVAPRS